MLLLLTVSACSSYIEQMKEDYEANRVTLVGAVWPATEPGNVDQAKEIGDRTAIGGVSSTMVAHDGQSWTYDLTWNVVILDEFGEGVPSLGSNIVMDGDEWTSSSGNTYRMVNTLSCTDTTPVAETAGSSLMVMMDSNESVASTDPDGARLDGAQALLDDVAGDVDRFSLAAFADGNPCVPDGFNTFDVDGSPWVTDAAKLDASIAGLEGCEAGTDHRFLDAVAAATDKLAAEESPVLVAFTDAVDSGSSADADDLAGTTPPLFLVRPGDTSDFSDQALLAQSSGGALVQAVEETIPAAFTAVGTLIGGDTRGYVCTATMEVTLPDEGEVPGWFMDTLYIPPSAMNVQVSLPYIVAF